MRAGTNRAVACVLVTLAVAICAVVAASPTSAAGYFNSVNARFYTDYEHIAVSYLVYNGGACVNDQYGLYNNFDCDSYASSSKSVGGDASLDIHVYYRGRLVHADQFDGYNGHASIDLYWEVDLGAPFCFGGARYSRTYRAVIRLFDPVTKRVIDHDNEVFGVRCS